METADKGLLQVRDEASSAAGWHRQTPQHVTPTSLAFFSKPNWNMLK